MTGGVTASTSVAVDREHLMWLNDSPSDTDGLSPILAFDSSVS